MSEVEEVASLVEVTAVEELFAKRIPRNQLELVIAEGIRQIIISRVDGRPSPPIPILIDGPDGKPVPPDHQALREAAFNYLGLGIKIPDLNLDRSWQQHLVTGSKYFPLVGECFVTLHAVRTADGQAGYELRDSGLDKS